MPVSFLAHPHDTFRLGDFLKQSFANEQWTEFRAAVAFVKRSGTKHIRQALHDFVDRGGSVRMSSGIDAGGTSAEGLQDLIDALQGERGLYVYNNANSSTFHPKIYLFKGDDKAALVVGSGNLTEGGLFTNYEAGLLMQLDLADPDHASLLSTVEANLDTWSTPADGLCYELDQAFLHRLIDEVDLPSEKAAKGGDEAKIVVVAAQPGAPEASPVFAWKPVPKAPPAPKAPSPPEADAEDEEEPGEVDETPGFVVPVLPAVPPQQGNYIAFVMTLQQTDVGVGQTTAGTSRRSPEIFIPLVCRDFDPDFWGWPSLFLPDPTYTGKLDKAGLGKMDRPNVSMRLGAAIVDVALWYNSDKKDLRMRAASIRDAGSVGDILYIERSDGSTGYSYYVDIVPQGGPRHAQLAAVCVNTVRNSKKKWAYI